MPPDITSANLEVVLSNVGLLIPPKAWFTEESKI